MLPEESATAESYIPHLGWLEHEPGDDVAEFLNQNWFEHKEQAFLWLYLRPGDVFLDCGAHVGLFSALASRITNTNIQIIAIEPNPTTVGHLQRNLDKTKPRAFEIIKGAAHSSNGKASLSPGGDGRSAYSSIAINVTDEEVEVEAFTIDEILTQRDISQVAFMKLDVEGAELAVLEGANESIASQRLPVVMIEFTESNLEAIGKSTSDLRQAWEDHGYEFYQLDEATLELEKYEFSGPIKYDNLLAISNIESVKARVNNATAEHIKIAKEIIARGQAAKRFEKRWTASAKALAREKASTKRLRTRLDWIEGHWSFKWYRKLRRLTGDRGGM